MRAATERGGVAALPYDPAVPLVHDALKARTTHDAAAIESASSACCTARDDADRRRCGFSRAYAPSSRSRPGCAAAPAASCARSRAGSVSPTATSPRPLLDGPTRRRRRRRPSSICSTSCAACAAASGRPARAATCRRSRAGSVRARRVQLNMCSAADTLLSLVGDTKRGSPRRRRRDLATRAPYVQGALPTRRRTNACLRRRRLPSPRRSRFSPASPTATLPARMTGRTAGDHRACSRQLDARRRAAAHALGEDRRRLREVAARGRQSTTVSSACDGAHSQRRLSRGRGEPR